MAKQRWTCTCTGCCAHLAHACIRLSRTARITATTKVGATETAHKGKDTHTHTHTCFRSTMSDNDCHDEDDQAEAEQEDDDDEEDYYEGIAAGDGISPMMTSILTVAVTGDGGGDCHAEWKCRKGRNYDGNSAGKCDKKDMVIVMVVAWMFIMMRKTEGGARGSPSSAQKQQ